MKKELILLSFFLLSVSAYAQAVEKFNYDSTITNTITRYSISLKCQQPISKDAQMVYGHFLDEQWLRNAYDSIIKKSISPNKLQLFTGRGGWIAITYSITGKVLKVKLLGISKEDLRILNEDDLSALFDNLYEFDIDMSKIKIEYPPNWIQGIEGYWTIVFPLKIW